MREDGQAELPRGLHGLVRSGIVHSDDLVHSSGWDVGDGAGHGPGRVIGGHDYNHLLMLAHNRSFLAGRWTGTNPPLDSLYQSDGSRIAIAPQPSHLPVHL